jgi:hypothetical protein
MASHGQNNMFWQKKTKFKAAVPRTITGPLLVDDVTWSLTAQVLAASSHNIGMILEWTGSSNVQ